MSGMNSIGRKEIQQIADSRIERFFAEFRKQLCKEMESMPLEDRLRFGWIELVALKTYLKLNLPIGEAKQPSQDNTAERTNDNPVEGE